MLSEHNKKLHETKINFSSLHRICYFIIAGTTCPDPSGGFIIVSKKIFYSGQGYTAIQVIVAGKL